MMFTSYHKVKIFLYVLQITEMYLPQQNQRGSTMKVIESYLWIFKILFFVIWNFEAREISLDEYI